MSSFTQKQLRVTLTLQSENTVFATNNSNTLVLTNLRMSVVLQAVAKQATHADISVFGMLQADMDALTVIWFKASGFTLNTVLVEATDGSAWFQVFSGTITRAQPDYRGAPGVFFHILAMVCYFQSITPAPSVSYPGDTDVAGIASLLAQAMGYAFENNGVKQSLATPHFSGSYFDQLQQLCLAAGIDFYIEGNVLAICPANGVRTHIPAVLLNAASGLVGYPVLQRYGVSVTCLFNPAIVNGGPITIKSDVKAANGDWHPYAIAHHLECNRPNGAWFSSLECYPAAAGMP
jgi:hypothetical protein